MPISATQPASDQIEVSLFGPGNGECVLVHAGNGDWLVVDSCRDSRTREQPALSYLRNIGVDPEVAVRLVVATHWHDDHIGGLSQVVRECVSAKFACSVAVRAREFQAFLNLRRSDELVEPTNIDELDRTFEVLQTRMEGNPPFPPLCFASALRDIWHRDPHPGTVGAEVVALTPSSATELFAFQGLESLMPTAGSDRKPIAQRNENATSVALWVRVGQSSVLLGSDLQETGHPHTGWSEVADAHPARLGRAVLFKVAHHGSQNGDSPEVWTRLLDDPRVAIVTPFRRSHLPTVEDRARICGAATSAFVTADPDATLGPRLPRTVAAAARSHTVMLQEAEGATGQIRARWSATGGAITIDLGPPARNLCQSGS